MKFSFKQIMSSFFFIYIPTIAILISAFWIVFDDTLEITIWIILTTLLLYTILTYIEYEVKYRQSFLVYLLPVVLVGSFYYYFKPRGIELLHIFFIGELLFFTLVLRGNWISNEIFLGQSYSKKELKQIRKGTIDRLKKMNLNESMMIEHISEFNRLGRNNLIEEGYLKKKLPEMGEGVLLPKHRTKKGDELLQMAKDILFAALYGEESLNVDLTRVENELLTITMTRLKAYTLQPYMKAVTESSGKGTWFDPENISHDQSSDNVILEVEYREVASEMVGNAIKSALDLINILEINEQILYIRMMNIEQSSLINI